MIVGSVRNPVMLISAMVASQRYENQMNGKLVRNCEKGFSTIGKTNVCICVRTLQARYPSVYSDASFHRHVLRILKSTTVKEVQDPCCLSARVP